MLTLESESLETDKWLTEKGNHYSTMGWSPGRRTECLTLHICHRCFSQKNVVKSHSVNANFPPSYSPPLSPTMGAFDKVIGPSNPNTSFSYFLKKTSLSDAGVYLLGLFSQYTPTFLRQFHLTSTSSQHLPLWFSDLPIRGLLHNQYAFHAVMKSAGG